MAAPPRKAIKEQMMPKITLAKYLKRLLLFIVIVLLHYLLVFVPIAELFLLYIIFSKPKWLDDF